MASNPLSLKAYVDFHHARGLPALYDECGRQAWVPDAPRELYRLPAECLDSPSPVVKSSVLRQRGIWAGSFLAEPLPNEPANCLAYVCRDPNYHIDVLAKNSRRDIRRGLRNSEVRRCTWEELAEKGYEAQCDTMSRHGYTIPTRGQYLGIISAVHGSPFHQLWGAWNGGDLAAWQIVVTVGNHAIIRVCRSMTVHLRLCPNNALLYESTYRLLRTDGITYVSYGLSSLQADANVRAMHAYKTRMGYEAIPCRRAFFFRPVIHSLLTSAPSSHLWPLATRLFPRIELLRKLAGLSRLIAAKDYETVTWVRQATSDQLPEQPLDPESG